MNKKTFLKYLLDLLIILLIIIISDAIMDSIKDYRVHLGQHPFRDFWHLLKHLKHISLILFGCEIMFCIDIFKQDLKRLLITIISFIIILILLHYLVWQSIYNIPEFWFIIDETFQVPISFGKIIDKLIGIHW